MKTFFVADDKDIDMWLETFSKYEDYEIIGMENKWSNVILRLEKLKIAKKLPHYMILDMKFEGDFQKGYEILKKIREKSFFNEVKIIISSNYDDTTILKEIIAKAWASAYLSKNSQTSIREVINQIAENREYWGEFSSRLQVPEYVERAARIFHKKIKLHLLPPVDYAAISSQPKYEGVTSKHDKIIVEYYKKEDLQLPISLDFSSFKVESEHALKYFFSPTQWIIFKELAKGRSKERIAKNCNTTVNMINNSVPLILEQFNYSPNHGNYSVFLIQALRMQLYDIFSFIQSKCLVTILPKNS